MGASSNDSKTTSPGRLLGSWVLCSRGDTLLSLASFRFQQVKATEMARLTDSICHLGVHDAEILFRTGTKQIGTPMSNLLYHAWYQCMIKGTSQSVGFVEVRQGTAAQGVP